MSIDMSRSEPIPFNPESDIVQTAQVQVDAVKHIMKENVAASLQQTIRLEDINNAAELEKEAKDFEDETRKVHQQAKRSHYCRVAVLLSVIIIILIIIIVPTVSVMSKD